MLVIAAVAVIAALLFVVLLLQRGGRASTGTGAEPEPYTLDSSAKQMFRASEGRLSVASSSGLQAAPCCTKSFPSRSRG